MRKIYYQLYHEYESYDPEEDDIVKFIGVFSSVSKAKEVIKQLVDRPGFVNFPKNSFNIYKAKVNQVGWTGGFCSWDEATNCIKSEK